MSTHKHPIDTYLENNADFSALQEKVWELIAGYYDLTVAAHECEEPEPPDHSECVDAIQLLHVQAHYDLMPNTPYRARMCSHEPCRELRHLL